MLKIDFFQIALKTGKIGFNVIKIAIFSKKYKKSLYGWGLRPRPLDPIASGDWGLYSIPPSVIRFRDTSLLNASPDSDISTFGSSLLSSAKSWLHEKPGHGF